MGQMVFRIRKLRVRGDSKIADVFASFEAQKDAFIAANSRVFEDIEATIKRTNELGKLPLWDEYKKVENYGRVIDDHPKRKMQDVRTKVEFCQFYTWLVSQIKPAAVLEFGSAFGASGMYWLAGLNLCNHGKMYSFEPNEIWNPIAQANFDKVSDRHVLTLGTFEGNIGVIADKVNIALIDAIHTRDFVVNQFELVRSVADKGALVLFDDINFSEDMKVCWSEISQSDEFASVWQLSSRVGIVELP
ncbi:putative O-methyltransferase family protein [Octadecabacter antarcticus 307]|uniref:Putative O-methyltransferase family protein n=2 Tax=Octadecabacter TaxID=53945 RepID=M9RGB0_9RHOB|nr:putative O-methyltransferase family protein [Octadecabacter antarcticus 307]